MITQSVKTIIGTIIYYFQILVNKKSKTRIKVYFIVLIFILFFFLVFPTPLNNNNILVFHLSNQYPTDEDTP